MRQNVREYLMWNFVLFQKYENSGNALIFILWKTWYFKKNVTQDTIVKRFEKVRSICLLTCLTGLNRMEVRKSQIHLSTTPPPGPLTSHTPANIVEFTWIALPHTRYKH